MDTTPTTHETAHATVESFPARRPGRVAPSPSDDPAPRPATPVASVATIPADIRARAEAYANGWRYTHTCGARCTLASDLAWWCDDCDRPIRSHEMSEVAVSRDDVARLLDALEELETRCVGCGELADHYLDLEGEPLCEACYARETAIAEVDHEAHAAAHSAAVLG